MTLDSSRINEAAFARGQEHAKMSKDELIALGAKPGHNGSDELGLGGCNENWGDTCIQSGNVYAWCNYAQYKCMSRYAGQNGAVTYDHMNKAPGVPETYE